MTFIFNKLNKSHGFLQNFAIIDTSADTSNWDRVEITTDDDNVVFETGGFYAFGVNGVFRGVIIILFVFIAFDVMLMSRSDNNVWCSQRHSADTGERIQHFSQTMNRSISSINTAIFLCLLGMAFALTTIQPVHLMVS